MRRFFSLILALILVCVSVYAVPLTLYISNLESSLYIQAYSISLEVGYPFSSVTIGNSPRIEFKVDESTPLYYLKGEWRVWENDNTSLALGAKVKAGKVPGALSNDKIKEVGRNYLFSEISSSFSNVKTRLAYVRYFSSVDENVSKGILFLAPPNYISEVANRMNFSLTYSAKLDKTFEFALIFNGIFRFSDAFVFSPPTFEFGFSISTTVEELQKSFQSKSY